MRTWIVIGISYFRTEYSISTFSETPTITTLKTGDQVKAVEESETTMCSLVEYSTGKRGYVDKDYLVGENDVEKLEDGIILVKAEKELYATADVYVRADDTTNSKSFDVLEKGEKVKATGICSNDWVRVFHNNEDAYVYGEYLSTEAPHEEYASDDSYEEDVWETQIYDSHSSQEDTSDDESEEFHSTPPTDEGYEEWLEEQNSHSNPPTDEGYEEWLEEQNSHSNAPSDEDYEE